MRADNLWLIGDPHFGREFKNGVPLHRRGEREKMQREQFLEELYTPGVDTVVIVGDLFDKPFVPLPVLSQVISDVVSAARYRPEITFIFMAGNHDLSRQLDVKGAWQIFELAVGWLPNVEVLNEPEVIGGVAYFPWQWDRTAEEQVGDLSVRHKAQYDRCVGHWDLIDFGGNTDHMVPTETLMALNGNVEMYSGHYHIEGLHLVNQVSVHCTGSMQPYAHGEGDMYLTLTVDEALARDDLHDKCVRIILPPGEPMPEIDCLQLTSKRESEVEEVELEAVGAQTFNVAECLNEELEKAEVPEEVRGFIKERVSVGD